MPIFTRHPLIISANVILLLGLAGCKPKVSEHKTDTITKLAFHYLNANVPDSLYQLTGKEFRKHISPVMWNAYKKKIATLLPFTNLTFVTSTDSVSIYKVDGKIPLNCYVSMDKHNKLAKFYFVPYQKELKMVSLSTSERKTDLLAQRVLSLINRKEADSVYLLAGDEFKKQIDITRWRNLTKNLFWLTPLPQAVFLRSGNGMNVYSMKPYQFIFGGIDKNGKFNVFTIQDYPDHELKIKKAATDNKMITHLDSLVDQVISAYIQIEGNVGISTGVFYKGKRYFYNYGERKKGSKLLPDNHTVYDIGSITKTFTSTLLAISVKEGKVSLETPITKFLPDSVAANPDLKNITFKMLANHTSGLPVEPGNMKRLITDTDHPYNDIGNKEILSALRHWKRTRDPGAGYEYSNFAVGLLGVLLEKIYHKSYGELIRYYIAVPLNMDETMVSVDTSKFHNLAQGYDGLFQPVPFMKLKALQSAGTIKSSAFDLLAYAKTQLSASDTTLGAAVKLTHQVTFDNGGFTIGLGWISAPDNRNVIMHNGGTVGYHANIGVDLSKQIAVVSLSNNVTTGEAVGINLMKVIQKMDSEE